MTNGRDIILTLRKPRFTASLFGLAVSVITTIAGTWGAVLVHGAMTERSLDENRAAIDTLVNRISAIAKTDSVLNERQVVNTMSIGAITAALKQRGIVVYFPLQNLGRAP